jgi:hypothetical protein
LLLLCTPLEGFVRAKHLEMNLFNDAILPVSLCTSFLLLGGCILRSALIF